MSAPTHHDAQPHRHDLAKRGKAERMAIAIFAAALACVVLACAMEARVLLAVSVLLFALACGRAEGRYLSKAAERRSVSGAEMQMGSLPRRVGMDRRENERTSR